jgi:putative transposase
MAYDPAKHHRRSMRLKGFDYSRAGFYFVTVTAKNRECLFGEAARRMRLNGYGEWVAACWHDIARHFPHADTDEFVVMPNHVHGIIVINDEVGAGSPRPYDIGDGSPRPYGGANRATLGQIVAYFKYQSTKQINAARETPGHPVWQRNYYEHVIRHTGELARVREYIRDNPLQWALDDENPERRGRSGHTA